jgi:hypothetical protein
MSACSRCGAAFSCGMVDAPGAPCWCLQMPVLPRSAIVADRENGIATCLCQACLKARLDEAANGMQASPPAD